VILSTRQDDFFVIFVKEEYPSILESVFKTEFLTVLSDKFAATTGQNVNINFKDQISYTAKKDNNKMKAWLGSMMGDERVLTFTNGQGDFATLTAKGKNLTIAIGNGLPMSSRPGAIPVRQQRQSFSQQKKPPRSKASQQSLYTQPKQQSDRRQGSRPNLHKDGARSMSRNNLGANSSQDFMKVPSPNMSVKRKGPPPPPPPKAPVLPQVRCLYDYQAQDAEELSFSAGDVLNLMKKEDSGWWLGEFHGRQGLFPNNYIEEI